MSNSCDFFHVFHFHFRSIWVSLYSTGVCVGCFYSMTGFQTGVRGTPRVPPEVSRGSPENLLNIMVLLRSVHIFICCVFFSLLKYYSTNKYIQHYSYFSQLFDVVFTISLIINFTQLKSFFLQKKYIWMNMYFRKGFIFGGPKPDVHLYIIQTSLYS